MMFQAGFLKIRRGLETTLGAYLSRSAGANLRRRLSGYRGLPGDCHNVGAIIAESSAANRAFSGCSLKIVVDYLVKFAKLSSCFGN
jgi:hypothetical protein